MRLHSEAPYDILRAKRHVAPEAGEATDLADDRERAPPEPERVWRCARCDAALAREQDQREMDGRFDHVFMNPHGFVFHVVCFARADGVQRRGGNTSDFSWFDGYEWSYAHCRACKAHLAWRFESGSDGFWGLILDKLREGAADPEP